MFGNPYVFESVLSTMKQVKSKKQKLNGRPNIGRYSLRLAATNTAIAKGTIVSENPQSQATH